MLDCHWRYLWLLNTFTRPLTLGPMSWNRRLRPRLLKRKPSTARRDCWRCRKCLKKVYEEIEHFRSNCNIHIFKKTKFKEEMKKLSEKISRVAWDAAIKMAQVQSQLSSAYREVSSLESLLASREARWKIVARSVKFQDELCWAQKKIAKFKRSTRVKESMPGPKVKRSPLAIIPY